MSNPWDFETRSIHSGFDQDEKNGATAVPIYETASFAYNTAEELADAFQNRKFGYLYSRITNPTVSVLEQRITALENGRGAIATASGMAAIATVLYALVKPGDEIVSSRSLFGGTLQLFKEIFISFGVNVIYVDPTDSNAFENAVTSRTRLFFVETIGNPKLDAANFTEIAVIAQRNNIPLVVDSSLTTPYLFEAKGYGANVVIHSTSKYISGSGHTIGGVLVDLGNYDWFNARSESIRESAQKAGDFGFLARCRRQVLQNTGGCLSPFNAYLQCLGLETLALRMEKHCSNALALARFLAEHPRVQSVCYPGLETHANFEVAKNQFGAKFGGLLTIRLGSLERCFEWIRRLKIAKNLANLGDAKTVVIHPASTIYCTCSEEEQIAAGVYPDLIRVSVGIESIHDIIDDFDQALAEV
ncbi:MAG TPA: acetyl-L-homoserine sulfhydrolase [Firmicutes bacterium]|jgi:O-acetylhomoserine (thiol)-lyase|nr:acetyl-L-homoserine sulfhydrolase [Bacillota bacterium]